MKPLKGKWVKGDYDEMSSSEMEVAFKKAKRGVKKPTAIEPKFKNGKMVAWRMYYKPIQAGEFWD